MSDIKSQLAVDLKEAMRARDSVRRDTIRGVRAAITNREVETGAELDDAAVLQLIRSLVKQRTDSIEQYAAGGRQDLVDRESEEKGWLEGYLPAAPDEATVKAAVAAVIEATGASGMKDMGAVMKASKDRLGPSVDGRQLSGIVKSALSALVALLVFACAGNQSAAQQQSHQQRLKASLAQAVGDEQARDEHSRLLQEVVDMGALADLIMPEVSGLLGRGRACERIPLCKDQGFHGEAWYYEVGVAEAPFVGQLPVLVVVFDSRGRVSRTWTLTTH